MIKLTVLLFALVTFTLTSCAEMAQQSCTPSAAYATGVNDATQSQSMQANYASICSYINMPPAEQEKINESYIRGYQFSLKNKPREQNINININDGKYRYGKRECINSFGKDICGYNCKQDGNLAICANSPHKECIAKFGAGAACGYGCIATAFKVACGKRQGYTCLEDDFNNIVCGKHCQKDSFGKITCDVYQ